jgi:hypothetical protein
VPTNPACPVIPTLTIVLGSKIVLKEALYSTSSPRGITAEPATKNLVEIYNYHIVNPLYFI